MLDAAWPGVVVEEANLAVQISAIRRVLGQADTDVRIETLPRRGYRLLGTVVVESEGESSQPAQSPPAATPGNLPFELDAFVGRDFELRVLARQWAAGARLITLTGTGGSGKTRLALRYASNSAGTWPGGIHFCDLSEARSEDGISFAVASAMGVLQQVVKRWDLNSEGARARLGAPQRYGYGPAAIEGLDVYRTTRPNAPINIYIHGGEWRLGAAKDAAFPAELFVHAGAHYVVPDFAWVQDVGGSLTPLAEQVRRAVAWVHRNAKSFGGDPDRIYVSGHSSGGHLAGVILTTDWPNDFNLPADTVKSGLCCSGMFDLKPVRLSARRKYIDFTDEMEHALSPQRHLDKLRVPVIVAHGALESPEFQRQSRDFASAGKARGAPVQLLVGEGYNHFEIIESLGNPYGLLGRAVLEQMQLAKT